MPQEVDNLRRGLSFSRLAFHSISAYSKMFVASCEQHFSWRVNWQGDFCHLEGSQFHTELIKVDASLSWLNWTLTRSWHWTALRRRPAWTGGHGASGWWHWHWLGLGETMYNGYNYQRQSHITSGSAKKQLLAARRDAAAVGPFSGYLAATRLSAGSKSLRLNSAEDFYSQPGPLTSQYRALRLQFV